MTFRDMRSNMVALGCVIAVVCLAGCVGTVSRVPVDEQPVKDVEADDVDLRAMSREMAAALIELPVIRETDGRVHIAFPTLENRTTTVDFDSGTIQSMIRTGLIEHSGGKFAFLDREASDLIFAERDAKRSGQLTSRTREDLPGADYFLIGRAFSMRKADGKQMSAYHRYSFRLTDAEEGIILWEDEYEFKKYGQPGIGYRGR